MPTRACSHSVGGSSPDPKAISALRPTPLRVLRMALCFSAASALVAGLLGGGATPVAVGLLHAPWDKLAHLVTYAALALLLAAGFSGRRPLLSAGLACAIGVMDELTQGLHPGRHADLGDLGADLAGALAAAVIVRYFWKRGG